MVKKDKYVLLHSKHNWYCNALLTRLPTGLVGSNPTYGAIHIYELGYLPKWSEMTLGVPLIKYARTMSLTNFLEVDVLN